MSKSELLNSLSAKLGIEPKFLDVVIRAESGWKPGAVNPSTGATGLIQFMPNTALSLGTTVEALRTMTIYEQWPFVEKYLLPWKSKMKEGIDVYFAVFFPLAMGKPDSFRLETKNIRASKIAQQNAPYDLNKDGVITKGEVRRFLEKKFSMDLKKKVAMGSGGLVIGLALLFWIWKKVKLRKY